MAAAVQEYGHSQAIVLFVVQPGEKNSYDQQVDLLVHFTQGYYCSTCHANVTCPDITFKFNKAVPAL